MKTIWTAGVVLGVLVELWTLVMGYTGWYKDPAMVNAFFLVIPLQIAVLWWALRKTAAEGRRFGGQVLAGLLISLVAGVIIFAGSYLFTTVLFPGYFDDVAAVSEQMYRSQGKSDAEIQALMESYRRGATPLMNSLTGVIGTVVTGLVASALIGAFVRRK
jgi:hypothetical protein